MQFLNKIYILLSSLYRDTVLVPISVPDLNFIIPLPLPGHLPFPETHLVNLPLLIRRILLLFLLLLVVLLLS